MFPNADEPEAEYCPVSIGAAVVGERWSLLIVRELMSGAFRFNEIHRGLPGLSRTTLSSRLDYLERVGVITARAHGMGYDLTAAGRGLAPVITALGRWTVEHHFPGPSDEQSDPSILIWRMGRSMRRELLPPGRVSIEFTFPGNVPHRAWIVAKDGVPSVCRVDPGFDVDLQVIGTARSWNEIWYGHRSLPAAIASRTIEINGPPALVHAFPSWFTLSGFADIVGEQHTRAASAV